MDEYDKLGELDLDKLSGKLDTALESETPETLKRWLQQKRETKRLNQENASLKKEVERLMAALDAADEVIEKSMMSDVCDKDYIHIWWKKVRYYKHLRE